MNITEFALRYSLKVKKDSCDDLIIPGRKHKGVKERRENTQHVYEANGVFFVYMSFPTKARWRSAQRRLLAAGLLLCINDDVEGTFTFDPTNEAQVKAMLKLTGIRVKRVLDPVKAAEMLERLNSRRAKNGPA